MNKPNPITAATGYLSLAICGYFALTFLYSVFAHYWPGPYVDYWIDIPNIEKFFSGQLSLHDLVSAHANVHRLLIPRLLFIADYYYFSGTNTLLILISLLCKLATLLLFNHIIRKQTVRTRLLLNILLFAAILNLANLSNVIHNSNMQWDLASVFACFAIYFYSQNLNSSTGNRAWSIAIAIIFFIGGFFSQAGALPIIFVFIFISMLNKKWLEGIFSVLFAVFVLYLTFAVLPINEPENPTYESALAMMVMKLKYVAFFVFKMFSGSSYFLDNDLVKIIGASYYSYSWLLLLMLLIGLVFSAKTKHVYNNLFLNIALFCFLMMLTIAAARVDFSPNTWPANRYQTNTLLFVLSLGLHSFFSVSVWFGETRKIAFQSIIFAISLGYFLIPQFYLKSYGADFSNKVFSTQAYMLTHGVNQNNGATLLPSIQQHDRIAEPDPFFKQNGFAWYANKQANHGLYRETKKPGEKLLPDEVIGDFSKYCTINTGSLHYNKNAYGEGYEFSIPLDTETQSFLLSSLFRNTYYTLDITGSVVGFSYLSIDREQPYSQAHISGYSVSTTAAYVAEIDSRGQAHCLYSLDHNTDEKK